MRWRNGSEAMRSGGWRAALFVLLLHLVFFVPYIACTPSIAYRSDPDPRQDQCPMGRPVYTCPSHTPDCTAPILVIRDQYELAYSPDTRTPLWVCETVSANELVGSARRKSYFRLDPQVPRKYQTEETAYRYMELYDKGHLAAAANQKHSQAAMDDTFIVTNIAPQQSGFNRGIWSRLEKQIRDWATAQPKLVFHIITGPIYNCEPGASACPAINGIRIPTDFYKIIAVRRGKEWRAIAVVIENQKNPFSEYLPDYAATPSYVQQRTGLDFMPRLSGDETRRVESPSGNHHELWRNMTTWIEKGDG